MKPVFHLSSISFCCCGKYRLCMLQEKIQRLKDIRRYELRERKREKEKDREKVRKRELVSETVREKEND